jgi:hypothetical protein
VDQTVTTGVGFKGDFSKAKPRFYKLEKVDEVPGEWELEASKGSTTIYVGAKPSGTVLRSARDITTTYDQTKGMMHVHLFNTLIPVEEAPSPRRGGSQRERQREHQDQ